MLLFRLNKWGGLRRRVEGPCSLRSANVLRGLLASGALLLAAETSAIERNNPQTGFVTTAYGTDAGLPQPIEAIVQTKDGYLWLATQGGLARFDGSRFHLHRISNAPALNNNSIQCLYEDGRGTLWIGTNRGLSSYRNGQFEHLGFSTASIQTLLAANEKEIWVGTTDGLYAHVEHTRAVRLLIKGSVRNLFKAADGRIWVTMQGSPPTYYADGAFHPLSQTEPRIADADAIAQTKDGALWFTTNEGVFRLAGTEVRRFGPESGLGSNSTRLVFVDREDNVWVTAGGLFLLGRGGPGRFGQVLPYVAENFRAMCEDVEGNLWLGTLGEGLIQLRPAGFRLFSRDNGLRAGTVRNVTEDLQGNLWTAPGREGPVRISPAGEITEFKPADGFDVDIFTQRGMADGSVWLGARRGLQVYDRGKLTTYAEHKFARGLFQDSSGAVWLATERGPVMRFKEGRFEKLGGTAGIPEAPAICFAEDRDGAIYIGYQRAGLARLKDGKVELFDQKSGLPSQEVRAIYPDREGNLWLGTKGRGLAVFSEGRWWNPPPFVDVATDLVCAIVEDDDGHLFLGTLRGIVWGDKAEILAMARGGPPATFHLIEVGNGVGSSTVFSTVQPAAWKARNGTLWFATRQGLLGIDPKDIPLNRVIPPVYIESASADDRPLNLREKVLLPAGTRRLSLEYSALSYVRPLQVRFKYRMEGYDHDWIDAGPRRMAYYANLPPGSYRFTVIASNNDGVWNETGASLVVEQAPQFYQTAWFRILLVAGLAGGTLGAFRWRVRRFRSRALALQHQNVELERRIAERTAELAKSYDTLRASEYFYHSLVESLPQIIARKDVDGRFTYANSAFADLVGQPLEQILGKRDEDFYPAKLAEKTRTDDRDILTAGKTLEYENVVEKPGQKKRYLQVKKVPLYDRAGQPLGIQLLFWDVTTFRETEEQLKTAQKELLEASRLAGMAEVATGVLHNIGNALNSVNISATVAAERIAMLKIPNLTKVAQLILDNKDRLLEFLTTDPRGSQFPSYLAQLSENLQREQTGAVDELHALRLGIEHVKEIVAAQQSYAHVSGLTEDVSVEELVDGALRIADASLQRHRIILKRELAFSPRLKIQRQKALQILVNLINNAKDAMVESRRSNPELTLRSEKDGNDVRLTVADNGSGIAPENITRIFAFGFTTKKDGHGFGLHSSALAAREMGGSLRVESSGLGGGATFILTLPLASAPAVPAPAA